MSKSNSLIPTQRMTCNEPFDIQLIATGTFNPPHIGHFRMMELAVSFVEKQTTEDGRPFRVVAALFSPSHEDYVASKVLNFFSI